MAQQGRWPKGEKVKEELEHKLSECIWWLVVLAEHMDIDISKAMEEFLSELEN